MRSMTGFGSGTYSDEKISITVEIKAVNQRFAEFNIRIPRTYAALEEGLRRQLKDVIHRGKTDVFVTVTELSKETPAIRIDFAALEAGKQALTEVKGRIFSEGEATFSETSALMSDWFVTEEQPTDTEVVWPKIQAAAAKALTDLTIMREREGKNIELDLSERAAKAEEYINFIDNHRTDLSEAYGQRLHKRIAKLLEETGTNVDESRILQEIAVFADKSDVTEEVVRFKSHVLQLKKLLTETTDVGRSLDFLLQEMNRETNTIGSKIQDLTITDAVLRLKNELEKIREQIQNIE